MRVVVQRVDSAKVSVDDQEISSIGRGVLVLLGVEKGDRKEDADYLIDKVANLRIFEDPQGKMNLSLLEISGGSMLVVSQFTLLANCHKGRRPSFGGAAEPELAIELYEYFIQEAYNKVGVVKAGKFQEMMKIELINNGPVTILLDSRKVF
jgi:D-tyrosyl-tRNA(Tyr) deacylase